MKRGKKYTEAAKQVDRSVLYDPAEAVALIKKASTAKFDETLELHIRTGCDGRHAEQQIRGAVVLPNGIMWAEMNSSRRFRTTAGWILMWLWRPLI